MKIYLPKAPVLCALLVLSVVGCSAEPMTVKEACLAMDNMMRNAPRGDEVASAEYTLPYWKEFSSRIDGALGAAFEDMAEADRFVIASGGVFPHDDTWWDTYEESFSSYFDIIDICRPFE